MHVFAEVAAELAGAGFTLEQVEDVAQGMLGGVAQGKAALQVRQELLGHLPAGRNRVVITKYYPVCFCQKVGVLVGFAADHHAIHFPHVIMDLIQGFHAAVKNDLHVGERLFDGIGTLVNQRWDFPVFLGRQAGQDRLAGMNGQAGAAGLFHVLHETEQEVVVILIINTDARLYGDGHRYRRLHGGHAGGHPFRLGHEHGADLALLDPVRGATHVQVDLVVAVLLADAGGLRQLLRVTATQLQGYRVFLVVE